MSKHVRDDDALQKIAERLKELRHATGKRQRDVLHETGIHIAAIETGTYNINVSTLERLCSYYGITPVEFFEGMNL